MKKRLLITLTLAAAVLQSPFVKAQDPQSPPGPPSVTFQVEVNYVDVDIVVTDEKGNFIPGLTRDDFEVFEDGKPQKIDMFSYVEIPVEKADRLPRLPIGRSTPDTQSNRQPFAGRLYVIVLDDQDVSRHANRADEESRPAVRRTVHGRQRRRRRHPHERPHRCRAGVHGQQTVAPCRDRQVRGPAHALAHARAARHVLPAMVPTLRAIRRRTATASPRRPIRVATRQASDPSDFERGFRASACSTR